MKTMEKPKAMKKSERELLTRWLKFYDKWLWQMNASSREAARFAKEDGLDFASSRRLAIHAKKEGVCESWKVEEVRKSVRFNLNGDQWQKLLGWVRNNEQDIRASGSVVAAATMAQRAGVRFSVHAMREAMSASDIIVPEKSPRPAWTASQGSEPGSGVDAACPTVGGGDSENLSPAQRQYVTLKKQHPDYLLIFRMGDFYELFFDDARVASKALGIALTTRGGGGSSVAIPMSGVPFHLLESSIKQLIAAGHKVAIAEQVSESKGKAASREVVRTVLPQTDAAASA